MGTPSTGVITHAMFNSANILVLTIKKGIFERLESLAGARGLRIISLNRREYPGTTPYSEEECNVITHGNVNEMAEFLHQQGLLIAFFIDGLLQELSLPNQLAIAGWSQGNTFSTALLAAIDRMPVDTRERLSHAVDHFFLWDPPETALGIIPIEAMFKKMMQELGTKPTAEERGIVFARIVAGYYQHGPLRDLSDLSDTPNPTKRNTMDAMLPEELNAVIAFQSNYDTVMLRPGLESARSAQVDRALLDTKVRAAWNGLRVWYWYGEASLWNCIHAAWTIEDKAGTSGLIEFKPLSGANHFVSLDYTHSDRILIDKSYCSSSGMSLSVH
ncbi:hypothetical protein H0H81_003967 [Sphagnurus paluster]|uniref:AB hydrolase-1 domain-containing protein n=1 Tax=Sphagnurus paluster TaxID=117069 RepID=A0A9P7GME9_9AGAR|nr:hypothetical protein H0H81_003967 [Sphagnurus paluster]